MNFLEHHELVCLLALGRECLLKIIASLVAANCLWIRTWPRNGLCTRTMPSYLTLTPLQRQRKWLKICRKVKKGSSGGAVSATLPSDTKLPSDIQLPYGSIRPLPQLSEEHGGRRNRIKINNKSKNGSSAVVAWKASHCPTASRREDRPNE